MTDTQTDDPTAVTSAPQATSDPETVLEPRSSRPARTGRPSKAAGGPGGRRAPRAAAATRPASPAGPVLERLFTLYPRMFGARFLPLKLGVFQELMAAHGDEFKKEDLKLALGQHARSTRYLESVAAGAQRHDLQGEPVEPVAPEHVQHAIFEVYRRRKARGRDDPRPWLVERLADAVDSANLARAEWDAVTGTSDEFAVAALDEAFAEVASRAARREALRRAFASSGLGVDAFADTYGMEPAVVRLALGPMGEAAASPAAAVPDILKD